MVKVNLTGLVGRAFQESNVKTIEDTLVQIKVDLGDYVDFDSQEALRQYPNRLLIETDMFNPKLLTLTINRVLAYKLKRIYLENFKKVT